MSSNFRLRQGKQGGVANFTLAAPVAKGTEMVYTVAVRSAGLSGGPRGPYLYARRGPPGS
jgi:hypothetical protein